MYPLKAGKVGPAKSIQRLKSLGGFFLSFFFTLEDRRDKSLTQRR